MSINQDYPVLPSALAVLNKINLVEGGVLKEIEMSLDAAIAQEKNRKYDLRDVFQSRAFWQRFRDGLAAPLLMFENAQDRRERWQSVRPAKREPDILLWKVIGDYCAKNPDILHAANLNDAELEKLNGVMGPRQTTMDGEKHAFHAG